MANNTSGVESIYRLINSMEAELISNPFCNVVTLGRMTEIDLPKQTIFPLADITLNNVTNSENTLVFEITITNLDIVEISKDEPENKIFGNDNLVYIWTNQLYVINRLIGRLRQQTIYQDGWELIGTPQSDFVDKEMENMLAGFETTLSIAIPNGINVC